MQIKFARKSCLELMLTIKEKRVNKTNRKFESELNLIHALQIEQRKTKGKKSKGKPQPLKTISESELEQKTILGLIERIKKL